MLENKSLKKTLISFQEKFPYHQSESLQNEVKIQLQSRQVLITQK